MAAPTTHPIATPPGRTERWLLAGVTVLALAVSFAIARDRLTWLLETIWAMVGLAIIAWRWPRFPLTRLLCWLLVLHALVLVHGGAYTYAQTPLGFWLRDAADALGWQVQRNPWDRVGHFMQGFVPAILAREILIRTSPLGGRHPAQPSRWLGFLVVSVCLAFSAFYELIEWWVAVASGAAADDFLGTQGYAWDTQSDMACALAGALAALLLLSRWHDRSMARLPGRAISPSAGR